MKLIAKFSICTAAIMAISTPALAATKTFVFCSEASPSSFNPQLVIDGASFDANSQTIYNRLIDFKPGTTEILPSLASSWDISADGLIYTLHLRKDVKFQSNKIFKPTRDFNADDLLFSFNRQFDPTHPYNKVSGGQYEYFISMDLSNIIRKIEKVDDYTVKFILNAPNAPFLADLGMDFTSILSAEYAEQMLKAGTPQKVDTDPIGTGPFQLVNYQKDAQIRYQAFDNYWKGKAKIDRLVFSITPDASVRYAKLQKGECHAMPFPNPADIAQMKKDSNITLISQAGLNIGYIALNVAKKPLDNLKVRQALNHAVNKQAILDAIYQGVGTVAKSPLPPTMWGYNDELQDYGYDVEKAKQLLTEAGLANGFETEIWAMPVARAYNPNGRRMAELVQADLAKIGVKTKIVSYEWGEYLQRLKNGDAPIAMAGWTGDNGDPDNFLGTLLGCPAVNNGSNYAKWCYKPFDDLIKQAATITDKNQRTTLYKQAQVLFNQQAPWITIANSVVYMPMRKEVKNYVINPLGLHSFYEVDLAK